MQSTIKTQFWALFGYSPPDYADVVITEQVVTVGNHTEVIINKHKFTEGLGLIIFGTYNVAACIILVNMLIAMMSTSFMNVQVRTISKLYYIVIKAAISSYCSRAGGIFSVA